MNKASQRNINMCLMGRDPMEHIVKFECGYNSKVVDIYYRNKNGDKEVLQEDFYPFLWAKENVAKQLYGDKETLRKALKDRNIGCRGLTTANEGKEPHTRMANGYRILFFAKTPMSNNEFHKFFDTGGQTIKGNDGYVTLPPIEQHMVRTGKRLFKGYNDYGELKRMTWSVETEKETDRITRIATYTTFSPEEEGTYTLIEHNNEWDIIKDFVKNIKDKDPDVLIGYNSEGKLWNIIDNRLKAYSRTLTDYGIKRNGEKTLKIGADTETYRPTIIKGMEDIDVLFSIRKAWEDDTDIRQSDIDYMAEYLKIRRENKKSDIFETLWKTERIERQLNQSNFLISKLAQLPFDRICMGGFVAVWRLLMLAYSYDRNLAIPEKIPQQTYMGGLSKLLQVGYVPNVVKLDYNSLYPSIMLTFNLVSSVDIDGAIPRFLEYILTSRETYKKRKALALERGDLEDAARNESLQRPLKRLGNSVYGAMGSGEPFYWTDTRVAEETAAIGRMALRRMVKHFSHLGYKPIVGDSFTGDTPLFVKYKKTGLVNILPVSFIFDEEKCNTDALGREYDYSEKDFWVYSRNGWQDVKYIYHHATDKEIYRVQDDDCIVDVTKDHSLYDDKKKKIKPTDIKEDTKLEYVNSNGLISNVVEVGWEMVHNAAILFNGGLLCALPPLLLNAQIEYKRAFYSWINKKLVSIEHYNKTVVAGVKYIEMCISELPSI